MKKIRYRDCSIGDVIEVNGPCTITVENKSGRLPRLKITTNQGSDISFLTGEQAHKCCDTTTSPNQGD